MISSIPEFKVQPSTKTVDVVYIQGEGGEDWDARVHDPSIGMQRSVEVWSVCGLGWFDVRMLTKGGRIMHTS